MDVLHVGLVHDFQREDWNLQRSESTITYIIGEVKVCIIDIRSSEPLCPVGLFGPLVQGTAWSDVTTPPNRCREHKPVGQDTSLCLYVADDIGVQVATISSIA